MNTTSAAGTNPAKLKKTKECSLYGLLIDKNPIYKNQIGERWASLFLFIQFMQSEQSIASSYKIQEDPTGIKEGVSHSKKESVVCNYIPYD